MVDQDEVRDFFILESVEDASNLSEIVHRIKIFLDKALLGQILQVPIDGIKFSSK